MMLEMSERDENWETPIYMVEASRNKGISQFIEGIYKHRDYLFHKKNFAEFTQEKARLRLAEVLKDRVLEAVWGQLKKTGKLEETI